MQHPDEGTIHAWLDGELSADEGAALEAHIAECADCGAAVAEARGIIAASSRIVSALDVIPGGVVPVASRHTRPWWASTQLRAAAAVLIVAGTTLLVINRQDKSFVETAARGAVVPLAEREQSSDMAAELPDTNTAVRQNAAAASPPTTVPSASRVLADRDLSVATDEAKGDITANTVTVVPPPAVARLKTLSDRLRERDSSIRDGAKRIVGTPLEEVVVTGAAVVAEVPPLKALRTDTVGAVRQTVYEVSPGVVVTLTETQPVGFQRAAAGRRSASEGASAPVPPPPAAASPTASAQVMIPPAAGIKPVTSIAWTDPETGRGYVLSGPLKKEELEAIRRRLQTQKR